MFAVFVQRGATELWGEEAHPLLHQIATFGPYLFAALFLVFVARALLTNHRYRAVNVLGEKDLEAVHAAIVDAEKQTVGEIVPVVVERSDEHPGARWTCAVVFLLLASLLFEGQLSWTEPHWLLLEQIGFGVIGYALAWWLPDLQRRFVSGARASEAAEEQAFQEFYRLGLQHTEGRTGVLLFVSLFERRVIVLGDEGIAEKLDSGHWKSTRDHILAGIRRGSLAHGLVEGIRATGAVLALHHPWREGDRNELPDRVVVRKR